jgi:Flp pilus assembly protein TadD
MSGSARVLKLVFRITLLSLLGLACASCGFFSEKNSDQTKAQASTAQDQQNLSTLTVDQWVNLSQNYFLEGKFLECIGAAQTALYLKPDSAEAYTNVGAAYMALRMWDPSIQASQQALRLKPDFQLARNNMAWVVSQKQLGGR